MLSAASVPATARAQAFPVDDSASQVLSPGNVDMRWDSLLPGPGRPSTISGDTVVRVVLDLARWRGGRGRLYMRLPPSANGAVLARWRSEGVLLEGALRDGERALVYAGGFASDQLVDTLYLRLQADGERVLRPQALNFTFEIEPEPLP